MRTTFVDAVVAAVNVCWSNEESAQLELLKYLSAYSVTLTYQVRSRIPWSSLGAGGRSIYASGVDFSEWLQQEKEGSLIPVPRFARWQEAVL